jgi:Putative transposase
VRVLSRLFRGKLLAFLQDAHAKEKLQFSGKLADLASPAAFQAWLGTFKKSDWVVYAKPPFGGPAHVLKYLARYTHRVAISNGRLLSLEQGQVSFRWRDSKDNKRTRVMTLDAVEFIRRFLLHVLPPGFVKIRHFGFLANRNRSARLGLCRKLLVSSSAYHPRTCSSSAKAPHRITRSTLHKHDPSRRYPAANSWADSRPPPFVCFIKPSKTVLAAAQPTPIRRYSQTPPRQCSTDQPK